MSNLLTTNVIGQITGLGAVELGARLHKDGVKAANKTSLYAKGSYDRDTIEQWLQTRKVGRELDLYLARKFLFKKWIFQ